MAVWITNYRRYSKSVKKVIGRALLVGLLLLIGWAVVSILAAMFYVPSVNQKAVAEGETKWNNSQIQNYTINVRMTGQHNHRTITTTVKQGVIVESSDDCPMAQDYCNAHPVPKFTIPRLFEEIKRKNTSYDSYYVRAAILDTTYGYPKQIELSSPTGSPGGGSDADYSISVNLTLD